MSPAARAQHDITRALAWIGLLGAVAGCGSSREPAPPPAPATAAAPTIAPATRAPDAAVVAFAASVTPVATGAGAAPVAADAGAAPVAVADAGAVAVDAAVVDVPADAGAAPVDANSGRMTLTIELDGARPPGSGLARRCSIAGDPIGERCKNRGGLAVDAAGVVYVLDGAQVRRYRRAPGEPCRIDPTGSPIELGPPPERMQPIDGPLYLRSGDPEWKLVSDGAQVYAHDFLGGLVRIDRGKPEPTCTDVFGFYSAARVGGRWVIDRNRGERLEPGARGACKARRLAPRLPRGATVYARDGELHAATTRELVRYAAGEPVRTELSACAITALTACGDGTCVLDRNCSQMLQISPDGGVRTLASRALFDQRPYTLSAAATTPGGAVLVLAQHRDRAAGSGGELCEAAVYELVSAVFAR
ncbi:MAG: hypothetical protein ACTHU0_00735 [Kofleriaceae bacterium]